MLYRLSTVTSVFYFVSALVIQSDLFTIATKQLEMENDEKIKMFTIECFSDRPLF